MVRLDGIDKVSTENRDAVIALNTKFKILFVFLFHSLSSFQF